MSKMTLKAEYVRATKDAMRMGTSNSYAVSIAANFKDKDGNDLEPEFFEVLLFGDAANTFGSPESSSFIKKGQSLNVEGMRQNKKWNDNKGNTRVTEQILVSDPKMIKLNEWKASTRANSTSDSASSNFADDEENPFG